MNKIVFYLIIALVVAGLILAAMGRLSGQVCYKTGDGKIDCSFPYGKYSNPPLTNAITCAYYSCILGCDDPKTYSFYGSWSYDDVKFGCSNYCENQDKICGKPEEPIKITINADDVSEIYKRSWMNIIESTGRDDYKDIGFVFRANWPENECIPCDHLLTPSFFLLDDNDNTASVIFPKSSECKYSIWTQIKDIFLKDVGCESCYLKAGNYEIWVDKANEKDNYDVIICPEQESSESDENSGES